MTENEPDRQANEERKPCPFCGEAILISARKCRYCGEALIALKYFVSKKNKRIGPYSLVEIQELLSLGKVHLDDYCWTEGWVEWQPLRALFPGVQPMVQVQAVAAPAKKRTSGCTVVLLAGGVVLGIWFVDLLQRGGGTATTASRTDGDPSPRQKPEGPSSQEQAREERKQRIERQFSAWDGSHHEFSRYLKRQMHDPKSYSHVATHWWDRGDHIIVQTEFRGKNAFGAVIRNLYHAKVTLDGAIVSVSEGPAEVRGQEEKEVDRLAANELFRAYAQNQFEADAKYKGKLVTVSGTIGRMDRDIFGNPFVVVDPGRYGDGVMCYFAAGQEPELGRLSRGRFVILRGRVEGLRAGDVVLRETVIR